MNVSPHCLRKTFATSLFRAGFDHVMVMRSLRHRDIRSVRIYDRRTENERAAAEGSAPQELCERLAKATGDRIAVVDLVLWRACNLGLLRPPKGEGDGYIG